MLKVLKFFITLLIIADFSTLLYAQTTPAIIIKNQAVQEMKSGRYGEAISLLNNYISARPQQPDGYNLRGLCYEKREAYELAVYDFRSARKLAPNDKQINENLSRTTQKWYTLLYNEIEGYKREIAINPNKADNYLAIGKSYKNLGKWGVAEQWYDQYLARAHASPDEIIRYSEILAKNNHIAKGWPILKKYTQEYPNDQRLWSRFGYFSMWLGKRKIAIDAFENALSLKPYFKEALDGLNQAKGKGYIYTVNDTSSRYNYGMPVSYIYPIDKYYRILRRHPSDVLVRMKLLKALYKANRLEEANQQLEILSKTSIDTTKEFQQLSDEIKQHRQKFYLQQIKEYSAKLKTDPSDKKVVLKLGGYYSNLEDYDSALVVYGNYLKFKPDDDEVNYRYAKVSAWNHDFQTAITKMNVLLRKDPNNLDYQFFRGQLAVWTGHDLDMANTYLQNYLRKYPQNLDAIIAMGSLNIQKQNFDNAWKYLDQAMNIDSTNPDVSQLQSDYEFQKLRAGQEKLFGILEQARELALKGDCDQALSLYDKYLAKAEPNRLIKKEYADVNACAKNYDKAINIYNNLLAQQYSYDIDLQRAKVYYWMGDSVNALNEFKSLAEKEPHDFMTNLYLGDSYTKMHDYGKARNVYDNLLDSNLDTTQIAMVNQRLSWLPVTGFRGFIKSFPNYALLSPYGLFYSDNLGFRYDAEGIRFDLGFTQFLSIGVEGSRSTLASDSLKTNFNILKWNLNFRLLDSLTMGIGFGNETFDKSNKYVTADAFLKYDKPKRFQIRLGYSKKDAAEVLYSPYLVGTRLTAQLGLFDAYYRFKSGIKILAKFNYIDVSDGNSGTNLEIRLGKYFYPNFIFGYEYYGTIFKGNLVYTILLKIFLHIVYL